MDIKTSFKNVEPVSFLLPDLLPACGMNRSNNLMTEFDQRAALGRTQSEKWIVMLNLKSWLQLGFEIYHFECFVYGSGGGFNGGFISGGLRKIHRPPRMIM